MDRITLRSTLPKNRATRTCQSAEDNQAEKFLFRGISLPKTDLQSRKGTPTKRRKEERRWVARATEIRKWKSACYQQARSNDSRSQPIGISHSNLKQETGNGERKRRLLRNCISKTRQKSETLPLQLGAGVGKKGLLRPRETAKRPLIERPS